VASHGLKRTHGTQLHNEMCQGHVQKPMQTQIHEEVHTTLLVVTKWPASETRLQTWLMQQQEDGTGQHLTTTDVACRPKHSWMGASLHL